MRKTRGVLPLNALFIAPLKTLLTALLLVGCHTNTAAPESALEVVEVRLPSPVAEDPPPPPNPVRTFLETMRERVVQRDFDGIEGMLFDFEPTPGQNTAPRLLEGIRHEDPAGDWAFSLAGLDALIARVDEFVVGTPETPASRMYHQADARLELERQRVFVVEGVYVMLVVTDEGVRLVFWEGITALAP